MAEIFPGNSNKAKEASLVREATAPKESFWDAPVVEEQPKEPAKKHQISPVRDVFAAIFPGGFAELKEHFIWDIFVPWMQDALHNGWNSIGDVIFPGSSNTYRGGTPERVSYDTRYRAPWTPSSISYDSDESMRPVTKKEADDIVATLKGICRRYGVVRLLDFNEMVGNRTSPTQQNYGWLNLDSATPIRSRNGGWVIKMPPAVPIDNS